MARNRISHLFEGKPKTTAWRERKELLKDLLTGLFPTFNALALIALKMPVAVCGCEGKYAMFCDD